MVRISKRLLYDNFHVWPLWSAPHRDSPDGAFSGALPAGYVPLPDLLRELTPIHLNAVTKN
jgi:hypothetical protein